MKTKTHRIMETKLTKMDIANMMTAAIVDAAIMDSLNILLTGDRRHEGHLRLALSTYMINTLEAFIGCPEGREIWQETNARGYDALLESADGRLPGFKAHMDELRSLAEKNIEREDASRAATKKTQPKQTQ